MKFFLQGALCCGMYICNLKSTIYKALLHGQLEANVYFQKVRTLS